MISQYLVCMLPVKSPVLVEVACMATEHWREPFLAAVSSRVALLVGLLLRRLSERVP
jgi:hypothetical protein